MFCMRCGSTIPEDGSFCPNCGEKIETKGATPPPTAMPVPQQASTPQQAPAFPPPPIGATPSIPTAQDAPSDVFAPNQPIASPSTARRSKKVPLIIGAAVLAVLIIGGAIFAFATIREGQQNDAYADAILLMNAGDFEQAIAAFEGLGDYKNAQALIGQCEEGIVNRENFAAACALLDAGDYEAALAAFTALGGYKDAAAKAEFCQQNIDFAAAQILFETGDVTGARSVFLALSAAGFEEADGWVNACDYHLADARLAEGGRYDAYEAFTALGGYEDAAAKAESCKLPYPSTGELWHDGAYASGGCAIELNCANASGGHYFKIYSDDKAVATLFINGGESLTCEVVPGYYTIKEATGDAWFGEPDLFGSNGWYTRMTYDDGTDYFNLAWNDIVSITLNTSENGNVGEEVEELEGF